MGSDGKESPAMQEIVVSISGSGRSLEKGMATHSSILAWRIPWTKEPGGLVSVRSQRVGHDRATSLSLSTKGQLRLRESPSLFSGGNGLLKLVILYEAIL